MIDEQKTVSEQELITMLSELQPMGITITPQPGRDERSIYAWQSGFSSGTHPHFLGALQAALEDALLACLFTPVPEEF